MTTVTTSDSEKWWNDFEMTKCSMVHPGICSSRGKFVMLSIGVPSWRRMAKTLEAEHGRPSNLLTPNMNEVTTVNVDWWLVIGQGLHRKLLYNIIHGCTPWFIVRYCDLLNGNPDLNQPAKRICFDQGVWSVEWGLVWFWYDDHRVTGSCSLNTCRNDTTIE